MEKDIERTRKLMIDTASEKGLSSVETLNISRKLDVLINEYEKHLSQLRDRQSNE